MRSLDPARASDRAAASSAVADVLIGALEGTLPAARCSSRSPGDGRDASGGIDADIVLARSCDGWTVVARMARHDGDPDTIEVRGPLAP
jgi:hypothetical protein